ncbi:zinc finger protein 569-like isoform X2 [Galleria mellonella]|uniref:Zinc finger protein 569-like isoform X2 n=1 Tax=Galleria mellonella TaxID=7137 RepID=A0A6J3C281_GALME|nr:zinc finger protein 569-like isoform X2 [Galleria mellonella]
MRCSVQFCTNDTKRMTKSQGITFHLFPKEENLRTAWIEALGMKDWEPKERSSVCSEHFRDEDFYDTKCGLRKIKNGAIPVIAQVCRICLAVNSKMYHLTDCHLDDTFQQITGITLNEEDRLPYNLCWECAHRLLSCQRLRAKALRSHTLMMEVVQTARYITIRDILTINRVEHNLKSSLIHKINDIDEFDMVINDDVILKTEKRAGDIEELVLVKPENDEIEKEMEKEIEEEENPPIVEVEVKDENNDNEIFFDEYVDYDSEDDKKLSEVVVKPKSKVKKKKLKLEKGREKKKSARRSEEEDSPTAATDKYKTSDVKRRKPSDGLDETLFTVIKLTYDEQIAEIQKRQESSSYKTAPFKCTMCYRGFQIQDRYDAHVIRHSDQSGAFECFICKSRLKTARALRKHLTAQHTEKFSCNGCPFVTRNRGVAREHEKWHAGARYQCPHCPSEFDKLTTYMGHIRIKHVSDFVCELCGYTFVSKKGIDVHKRKKHRVAKDKPLEGPYCAVCDVTFVSEEAHSRHLKLSSKHSSDNDPNRIRNDSQSKSSKYGRVVRHIERRPVVHARLDRPPAGCAGPVTCEQCGVQLRDLRLYAQHFRRAHPDKNRTKYPAMKTPCMCEQCGRIFQSMALLKDHMWVHTGEKRFKCDRCDKSFTQKTNLVFHLRVHSATRPTYECPLCGKHFAFFNNRRRHMFIHTGLKPFKCETCGKCFTTAGEQRAHVDHVHLKKPWPKRARGPRMQQQHDGDAWQKCAAMED